MSHWGQGFTGAAARFHTFTIKNRNCLPSWHFALRVIEPGCRHYTWNSLQESCGSRDFVKCVCQSCEVETNTRTKKLTLTLCGFLQCSLSTLSTVMLLGRITTSLLLSLHVSSHSSPVKQHQLKYAQTTPSVHLFKWRIPLLWKIKVLGYMTVVQTFCWLSLRVN